MTPILPDGGFLVPSLLPTYPSFSPQAMNSSLRLPPLLAGAPSPTSTFYFFISPISFASKLGSRALSLQEMSSFRFLPQSLFVRLVCRTISWIQETSSGFSSSSIARHLISTHNNFLLLKYGSQVFRICFLERDNLILVEVEGKNPIPVYRRISQPLQDVISTYF